MQEEQKTVDIGDENEEAQEIDLDAPAPEQSLEEEIHVEKVEDNSQSADSSQESSEQSDVPVQEDKREESKSSLLFKTANKKMSLESILKVFKKGSRN